MSFEAEQAVLFSIMLERDKIEVAISEGLTAHDFHHTQHKVIFENMLEMDSKNFEPDVIALAEYLEGKRQIEDAGGRRYLIELSNMFANNDNVAAYSKIIIESGKKRKLSMLSTSIQMMIESGATSEEIEIEANALLTRLEGDQGQKTSFDITEALKAFTDKLQQRAEGLDSQYKSGLADLDRSLKIENGRLYVIAGRPAMGKSTLAQVIAETTAKAGISTLFFSLEMPKEELASRMIASLASIDRSIFKDPAKPNAAEGLQKLGGAITTMKKWPIEIDNKGGLSLADVKVKSNAFFRKSESYKAKGLGLIVVDYLGLMKLSGDNRVHGLGEITKGLKQLAMRLNIPIILLHQLNRGVDSRAINDRRPYMSDLRDSGEIEEDADAIIFVYRDEAYNEHSDDRGIAELIIRKNRDGELGAVRVLSQLKYSRFANLGREGGFNG